MDFKTETQYRQEISVVWGMIDQLKAENAALKEQVAQLKLFRSELAAVALAIPDCRYMDPPDGGSVSLSEQVGRMWQDVQKWQLATSKNAECIRDQHETIAQQAEAIRLKDEAIDFAMTNVGALDVNVERVNVWGKLNLALAVQPSPKILQARDERVSEACAVLATTWGNARLDDNGGHALRNCAAAIRSGGWRKYI